MAEFWVDDGATSSWLGPLLVGAQRRSDGRIALARIDPELLRTSNWQSLVKQATREVLDQLEAAVGDTVLLCRGHLFNEAAPDLRAYGLTVRRGVITGDLQARLHAEGRHYLRNLTGHLLGSTLDQMAWVAADPDGRLRHLRARFRSRLPLGKDEVAAAHCAVL